MSTSTMPRACAACAGRPWAGARARARERCGLTHSGRRLIANLSKGYKQRVGIAQAIIHDPKVVILDEPTGGLDPNQIQEIRTLIRALGEERGVLLSTHILPEVEMLCGRALILHQERLVHEQPLDAAPPGNRLALRLGQPPDPAELAAIAGVTRVEADDGEHLVLHLSDGTDPSGIADHCVAKGWRLLEMSPVGDRLEQLFSRITLGESAP
ncbi:MAG: ATP-binding cassette domain-containing protein [gamma proteobacterium symbiont of Phacoides pectinatus]